jgi:hypothetical protein
MERNLIFKKCRYFNDPNCPSQNPEAMMKAVKAIIVLDFTNGNIHSIDGLDFIQQFGKICTECKKHKDANPNLSTHR